MRAQRIADALVMLIACMAAARAPAHHAFAAEFDIDKPITLEGTLREWEMINPHSWFHIDVENEDGDVITWRIEGGSPTQLIRQGVTKSSLPIGMRLLGRTRRSAGTSCCPTAADCFSQAPHPARGDQRADGPARAHLQFSGRATLASALRLNRMADCRQPLRPECESVQRVPRRHRHILTAGDGIGHRPVCNLAAQAHSP